MDVIIAHRDPTQNDQNYSLLWWNINKNRFFKFIEYTKGIYTWKKLNEMD